MNREQPKIKIFVSHHKPGYIYEDDIFVPIQVGKKNAKVDLGILGDDTGDNISDKNSNYAELTAQYWVWKNYDLSDVDYVGFCSYRRYMSYCFKPNILAYLFKRNPYSGIEKEQHFWRIHAWNEGYYIKKYDKDLLSYNSNSIKDFIQGNNFDILFPKREIYITGKILSFLKIPTNGTGLYWPSIGNEKIDKESLKIFCYMYPEYVTSFISILNESKNNIFVSHRHTFIMKKELFFDYAKRLFDYLFAFGKYLIDNNINPNDYFYDKRFIGIFSEVFINYWRVNMVDKGNTVSFHSNYLFLQ